MTDGQDWHFNRRHGHASGGKRSLTWRSWIKMRERCLNPKAINFARYGGRGVTVCAKWRDSFEAFLADMGERPGRSYSIERIDGNRGYQPGNCRWATPIEQATNRRSARLFTHDGLTLTVAEWSRRTGLPDETLRRRIIENRPPAEVFSKGNLNGTHR